MKTYKECDVQVDILGTIYTLHICPDSKDDRFEKINCGGFCDYSTKELFVSNYIGSKESSVTVKDPQYIIEHAIRHELVHAFLYESGLGEDWEHKELGHEETTVDWIARQIDKIHTAFAEIFEKIYSYKFDTEENK